MVVNFFTFTGFAKRNIPNTFHISDILTYLTFFHTINKEELQKYIEKRIRETGSISCMICSGGTVVTIHRAIKP